MIGSKSVGKFTVLLTAALAIPALSAQADDAPAEAKLAAVQPEPAKKRAEPRGRLPAFYGQVVNDEQREAIYAIQQRFADQIRQLRQQLDAIQDQQTREVEAVLTPEQRAQVERLRAESALKRKQRQRGGN